MDENLKEVRYDLYCEKCVHFEESQGDDPCHYCLEEPARQYTRKPLNFKEKV